MKFPEFVHHQGKERGAGVMRKGSRAMKKLVFLGLGSALLMAMGGVGPAQADNGPHNTTGTGVAAGVAVSADGCATCHRAHTAQGAFLLKTGQEGMCVTCHGNAAGGATTNVLGGVGYSNADKAGVAGALRGGGFDSARIDSATPTKDVYLSGTNLRAKNQSIKVLAVGAPTTSKHNVGAVGTAWGSGALNSGAGSAVTLECGSCHDPHGNGNYRILRPIPGKDALIDPVPHEVVPAKAEVLADPAAVPPVVYSPPVPAVMTSASGIKIPDATVKVYTTLNYWLTGDATVPATVSGSVVASPDGFIANVSDWCTTCHTRYLAGSESYKNDSGDAMYKFRHRTNRIDKVGSANCITCHVAHGSNASATGVSSSQVLQPDGTAAPVGDSRLLRVDNRGICAMCHTV